MSELGMSESQMIGLLGREMDGRITALNKERYIQKLTEPPKIITLTAQELRALATKVGAELSAVEKWVKPFDAAVNGNIFKLLCLYFSGDERMRNYSLHPDKGICLRGPVGCGKSIPMRILSYAPNYGLEGQCINPVANFQFIKTEQIRKMCDSGTQPSLFAHLRQANSNFKHETSQHYIGWCLDDVGSEDAGNYKRSYIAYILDEIEATQKGNYHYFHMTTNADDAAFAAAYGDRLLSRLYQIFNVIDFPADAPDLRRSSVDLSADLQL